MGMHLHLTAGGLHRPTVLEKSTRIVAMAPALILNVFYMRSREMQIGLIGQYTKGTDCLRSSD